VRMQYKIRYRPLERLGREGWERISDAEHDSLIRAVASAAAPASGAPAPAKDVLPRLDADFDSRDPAFA